MINNWLAKKQTRLQYWYNIAFKRWFKSCECLDFVIWEIISVCLDFTKPDCIWEEIFKK